MDKQYKPIDIQKTLLEDEAGNKIVIDADEKVAVINNEGDIVNAKDTELFLKENGYEVIKTEQGRMKIRIDRK